jgi:hypothetical protein
MQTSEKFPQNPGVGGLVPKDQLPGRPRALSTTPGSAPHEGDQSQIETLKLRVKTLLEENDKLNGLIEIQHNETLQILHDLRSKCTRLEEENNKLKEDLTIERAKNAISEQYARETQQSARWGTEEQSKEVPQRSVEEQRVEQLQVEVFELKERFNALVIDSNHQLMLAHQVRGIERVLLGAENARLHFVKADLSKQLAELQESAALQLGTLSSVSLVNNENMPASQSRATLTLSHAMGSTSTVITPEKSVVIQKFLLLSLEIERLHGLIAELEESPRS